MKVALACAPGGADVRALAALLRARGIDADLVTAPPAVTPVDALLRRRGFEEYVTAIPFAMAALGRADVAHAFTLADAFATVRSARPLVLHLGGPVSRDVVAAKRLRFKFLKAALETCHAITAADEATALSAARWLGVDAQVVDLEQEVDELAALYDAIYSAA